MSVHTLISSLADDDNLKVVSSRTIDGSSMECRMTFRLFKDSRNNLEVD